MFATGGDALRELARYDRDGLALGQLWRLAGAHFVHLGWPHTWMNVTALTLLAVLFEDVLAARDWLVGTILSAASIDAGLYWLAPQLVWYVGLSGVLHGLLALGGIKLASARSVLGYLLLAGLILKLGWEQWFGSIPFSEHTAGGPVIVDAHLYGAAGGALSAMFVLGVRRYRKARL
jgi:rhomboid family GlyGly-CTERM serine protease